MLKSVTLALILLSAPATAQPLDQQPHRSRLPCDFRATTVWGADRLIACEARKLRYSEPVALCIGDHESGDDPTETSGPHLGILQYLRSTFAQHWAVVRSWVRLRPGQRPGPFNPRSAVIAGIHWMKHRGTYPWTTAAGCGA